VAATWMSVGCMAGPDAHAAGAAAARAAVTGPDPKLLVVFFAASLDAATVLAGIRSVTDRVPLIGCPTSGEISGDWAGDGSVVVTALGGPGLSVRTTGVGTVSRDPEERRAAGSAAVVPMADLEGGEHRFVLLLTDGQAGNQQHIIRGAYATLGAAVPLVGGCGANLGGSLEATPSLLWDDRAMEASVVAACVASDNPIGIGIRHGWERTGEAAQVTSANHSVIYELDGQPALDAYLTRLEAPAECWTDPSAFQQFSLLHPFGIRRPSGDEIRVAAIPDYVRRSIRSAADIPEDSVAWLMRGDAEALLAATDQACEDAIGGLGDRPLIGLVAFDCIGRRMVFKDGPSDVARMAKHASGAPLAGFYSFGEIARTRGVAGYHNQALVVLALS
jgi:hypothetical protein